MAAASSLPTLAQGQASAGLRSGSQQTNSRSSSGTACSSSSARPATLVERQAPAGPSRDLPKSIARIEPPKDHGSKKQSADPAQGQAPAGLSSGSQQINSRSILETARNSGSAQLAVPAKGQAQAGHSRDVPVKDAGSQISEPQAQTGRPVGSTATKGAQSASQQQKPSEAERMDQLSRLVQDLQTCWKIVRLAAKQAASKTEFERTALHHPTISGELRRVGINFDTFYMFCTSNAGTTGGDPSFIMPAGFPEVFKKWSPKAVAKLELENRTYISTVITRNWLKAKGSGVWSIIQELNVAGPNLVQAYGEEMTYLRVFDRLLKALSTVFGIAQRAALRFLELKAGSLVAQSWAASWAGEVSPGAMEGFDGSTWTDMEIAFMCKGYQPFHTKTRSYKADERHASMTFEDGVGVVSASERDH